MTAGALVGALIGLSFGVGYMMWVRQRMQAPMPEGPHTFNAEEAVRFLGTAKVAGQVATWPRGELLADASAILVRAPRRGPATADDSELTQVLIGRDDVRSVTVRGSKLSRRVTFELVGRARKRVGEVTFGAALADPAPALRSLDWPVG